MVIPIEQPNRVVDWGFWTQLQDAIANGAIVETDQLLYTTDRSITKTNLGQTYVDLFPDFGGRPILVDTTGFSRMAIQIFWNKANGNTSHDLRIINNANDTQVLFELLNMTNGENVSTNVAIPIQFINFLGKLRIQVKAGNNQDDPVFEGIRIYLRR